MSQPIQNCFNCKKEIPVGKYYSLWKILKDEWDKMPDNEKEQHHVGIGNFCPSCWENKKPEINKVLPDYEQHIKDGYLTLREREREREQNQDEVQEFEEKWKKYSHPPGMGDAEIDEKGKNNN